MNATSGLEGGLGGPLVICSSFEAMGLRQVTDLSDYTVPELLRWIRLATQVLKQKLNGEVWEPESVWSDSSSGVSVVELEGRFAVGQPKGSVKAAGASSSSLSSRAAAPQAQPQQLRSPLTCEFHCKFCQRQCCRPEPHKNHACVEHRRWR